MKTYKLLFVLLIGIMLTSCTSTIPGTQSGSSSSLPTNIYSGTEGIVVSFSPNILQSPVYVTSDTLLPLGLKVENKGSKTLDGYMDIFLSGFDKNYIQFPDSLSVNELIEGKTRYNPQGGVTFISEEADVFLPDFLNSYNPNFVVSWLYDYSTIGSATVCIDPKPYAPTTIRKSCNVQDVSMGGGQGAPVEITRVEVKPVSSTKTNFNIHVRNSGRGSVVNSFVSSPSDLVPANLNKIDFYEVTIGDGESLFCNPSELQFYTNNAEAIIQCSYDIPGVYEDAAYETVLQVRLNYKYYDSISKKVSFLKVENEGFS